MPHLSRSLVGIFDGDCGICSAFVEAVTRQGADDAAIGFVPSQAFGDPELADLGLSRAACEGAFVLVDTREMVVLYTGARAINEVLIRARHPLASLAASLLKVPGMLTVENWVYAIIAKNRTALSVRLGLRACTLPGVTHTTRER